MIHPRIDELMEQVDEMVEHGRREVRYFYEFNVANSNKKRAELRTDIEAVFAERDAALASRRVKDMGEAPWEVHFD